SQSFQMQEMDALFGSPNTSSAPNSLGSSLFPTTSNDTANSILQSLDASFLASSNSASSSDNSAPQTGSTASQLAVYQSALDAQQVQDLFASEVNSGSSPLVNVLA